MHPGEAAKLAGIQTAVDHADSETPSWSERAYAYLQRILSLRRDRGQDAPFMAE